MPALSALRLTSFRSYSKLDLELSSGPVVLYGENGAGKTNLLEAISLLNPGRGLRRAKLDDLMHRQAGALDQMAAREAHWAVSARIMPLSGSDVDLINVGVGQLPDAPRRRAIRIDGKAATGTQLAQLLHIMWLTPVQDRLFTGPASDRRGFLDRFCLTHAPEHGKVSLRYEKARSERNRLLSDNIDDDLWFDALEGDMADCGAAIAMARAATINALKLEIEKREDGAFPVALIDLEGEAESLCLAGASHDDAATYIQRALRDDRALDRRAGRTLRGVHKSDLKVVHKGKNMPASVCSTGEQKALLIGLVLAQAWAQKHREPILLLDEVAAHLDEQRRAALIEELIGLGMQVFMTGTDAHLFDAFAGRAQMLRVEAGAITSSRG